MFGAGHLVQQVKKSPAFCSQKRGVLSWINYDQSVALLFVPISVVRRHCTDGFYGESNGSVAQLRSNLLSRDFLKKCNLLIFNWLYAVFSIVNEFLFEGLIAPIFFFIFRPLYILQTEQYEQPPQFYPPNRCHIGQCCVASKCCRCIPDHHISTSGNAQ